MMDGSNVNSGSTVPKNRPSGSRCRAGGHQPTTADRDHPQVPFVIDEEPTEGWFVFGQRWAVDSSPVADDALRRLPCLFGIGVGDGRKLKRSTDHPDCIPAELLLGDGITNIVPEPEVTIRCDEPEDACCERHGHRRTQRAPRVRKSQVSTMWIGTSNESGGT